MIPVALRQASYDAIYHPCIIAQRNSSEIVVYCPELREVCEIAYPIGRNHSRILAKGLRNFLRRRGVYWACFCSLTRDNPVSCRIVEGINTGTTYAFCHFSPPQCAFFMNLDKKRRTAVETSQYNHIPPSTPGIQADIQYLARSHRELNQDSEWESALYFHDYLGSYGERQLAGAALPQERQVPIEWPHNQALQVERPMAARQPQHTEAASLRQLARGEGISSWEGIGLVEVCQNCGKWWAASVLQHHIRECTL